MFVHLLCADLNFHGPAFAIGYGRMQRLVIVAFWGGDVIVKFTWYGLPKGVDQSQSAVTTRQVIHQNTHRSDIE